MWEARALRLPDDKGKLNFALGCENEKSLSLTTESMLVLFRIESSGIVVCTRRCGCARMQKGIGNRE